MKNKLILLISLFPITIFLSTTVHSNTERQLDSHDHGVANLNLVIEETKIAISFESPAVNLVGFETAPTTETEQAQIEKVKMQLGEITNLLNISESADCKAVDISVNWQQVSSGHQEHEEHEEDEHEEHAEHEHEEDEHEEHAEHEHEEDEHEEHAEHEEHEEDEHEAIHAEFSGEYLIECGQIDNVEIIEIALFNLYPSLESILLRAILPTGQTKLTLTPDNNQFSISQ